MLLACFCIWALKPAFTTCLYNTGHVSGRFSLFAGALWFLLFGGCEMDGSGVGRSPFECATLIDCVVIEKLRDVEWLIECFRATEDYAECDGAARFADVLQLAVSDARRAAANVSASLYDAKGVK